MDVFMNPHSPVNAAFTGVEVNFLYFGTRTYAEQTTFLKPKTIPAYMKKWEYKVVETSASLAGFEEVNKLGKEGWELVAAVPKTELGITDSVRFIFKRKLRSKN